MIDHNLNIKRANGPMMTDVKIYILGNKKNKKNIIPNTVVMARSRM